MSDYEDDENAYQSQSKNQIRFKVQNNTDFELVGEGCFADSGDFAEPPSSIAPHSSGAGGHVVASRFPPTGSAGMVGYKISAGSETFHLHFLGSNPYLSAKDNYSTSAIKDHDQAIDQANYNWLFYREETDDSKPFNGGTLRVTSQIGQADDATAIFTVTFEE